MNKKYFARHYQGMLIVAINKKLLDLIIDALGLIKREDKCSFRKILRCLKIVFVPVTKGYLNGVYEKNRIWIVEGSTIQNNQVSFIASSLIHESHHISQYLAGHKYKLPNSEISALKEQKKFLKKIDDQFSLNWLEKELKRKWWKDVVRNKKRTTKLDNYLKLAKIDSVRPYFGEVGELSPTP